MILSIKEIKRRKTEAGYTNEQLAALSGVPLATVQKVLGGSTASPRYKTLEALSKVFEDEEPLYETHSAPSMVNEPGTGYAYVPRRIPGSSSRYPRQGQYTVDDYLALPDDQRVELIDGVFYDMSAPTIPHQTIGGEIFFRFYAYLKKKKAKCKVYISPVDVQLDRDNRTMVQPDVMVVCDRDVITRKRLFGAPDLAVEVLSPSTKNKDILIKTSKYQRAGVKEYWMVDPMKCYTTKMLFTKQDAATSESDDNGPIPDTDIEIRTYPFDTPVPVTLFNEELSIDFKEIADSYSFLDD